MNHFDQITQEFKAIKKALNAEGYSTRKEPTYPKWKISASRLGIYLLSYCPKTRQWNLSGQGKSSDRIWAIIQKALATKEVSR